MKKRNFETKIITGLLTAGMILSLTACGSSSKGSYGISDLMDADYEVASNEAAAPEASAYEDGFGMTEGYDSAENAQDTSTTVPEETAATADRKLIKTVNMDVETREYDKLLSAVENKVTELGGYIESLDAYNGSTYYSYRSTRNANLTIRIPKDRLEEFQNTVSELGNVTSRSENVQDVTLTYVDLQSHRDALRTEQERLLQLLEQAESVEDIITIEQRLSDVRYQLESMESQLRSYDNRVDYSTVYLYIDEVEVYTPVEEETVWERISTGFVDSLKNIGEGLKEAAIWFVIHIPYLVIWAIVITVIAVIALAVLVVVLVRGHKPADTLTPLQSAEPIPVSADAKLSTPVGDLVLPQELAAVCRIEDVSADGQYAVRVSAPVGTDDVLLFVLSVGENGSGYALGSAPDASGAQTAIWLDIHEIPKDAAWTADEYAHINALQSFVNDLIEQINHLEGFQGGAG